MILDAIGTEFRSGRLILPEEWRLDKNRPLQWWMPQGDRTVWVFVVRSVAGTELWKKPFGDFVSALKFQHEFLCGNRHECPSFDSTIHCAVETAVSFLSVGDHVWICPDGITPTNLLPLVFDPGDPQHDPKEWLATNGNWTSSNSTAADWFTGNKAPAGVTATDYAVIGGGAGSGGDGGGGGGAGGLLTSTGLAVTPGNAYTVTVGAGGAAATSNEGGAGGASTFSSVTSGQAGGGGGSSIGHRAGLSATSGGGSGGGGWRVAGTAAGTGTSPGNNGGAGSTGLGGGGGGAGAVGSASGGGNGSANSIPTGSSVTYCGGGGGGRVSGGGTVGTSGGSGGGGNGGGSSTAATAGTANTGGGGGGGYDSNNGQAGGSGLVGLSYTVSSGLFVYGNIAMIGM